MLAVSVAVDENKTARESALRRRRLTHLQRLALVSSPVLLLQGHEFADWASPVLDEAVARLVAQPPRASLGFEIVALERGEVRVRVSAAIPSVRRDELRLYLAAYRRDPDRAWLSVRQWLGPLPLPGAAPEERVLAVPVEPPEGGPGVVGFVQNRRNFDILQALMLPACP